MSVRNEWGFSLETLTKSRAIAHASASRLCKIVRGLIMGLPLGQTPTDLAINNSPIFTHIAVHEEVFSPWDISPEMIQALTSAGHLATTRYENLDLSGSFKLAIYTWDNIKAIHPEIMAAYRGSKSEDDPRLVIVIPHTATNVHSNFGLEELFTISCLKRQTIKVGKHPKQLVFCGVHGGNFESSMSHVRGHVGLHFVCGGCFGVQYKKPVEINEHLLYFCPATTEEPGKEDKIPKKEKKKKSNKKDSSLSFSQIS